MNRAQRRQAAKSGYVEKQVKLPELSVAEILKNRTAMSPPNDINTGDKVRLDIAKIQRRINYSRMNEDYKQFVEQSNDKVFTAVVERENLIHLEEEPKWLFWSGDLIIHEQLQDQNTEAES